MSHALRLRHRVGEGLGALWSPGDRVAVAVSGGVDSVCLLDLLHVMARWHGAELVVATADHGTRAAGAAEVRFVEGLALERGLDVHVAHLDLGPGASEGRLREARYAWLAALDVDRVALAHHRDDQAETVLLALLRGHGVRGLGGMRPRTGRYVRPLLDVGREDLLRWALHRGLTWVEDPTNASREPLRNRLRHEVLPLLEEARPGARRALARSARLAATDEGWISARVNAPEGRDWPVEVLRGDEPLARRALLAAVPDLRAAHVDAVLEAARRGRGIVAIGRGREIRVRRGRVLLP